MTRVVFLLDPDRAALVAYVITGSVDFADIISKHAEGFADPKTRTIYVNLYKIWKQLRKRGREPTVDELVRAVVRCIRHESIHLALSRVDELDLLEKADRALWYFTWELLTYKLEYVQEVLVEENSSEAATYLMLVQGFSSLVRRRVEDLRRAARRGSIPARLSLDLVKRVLKVD